MNEKEFLASVLDAGQQTVEMVARTFQGPEDDWAPSALLVTGDRAEWSADHFPIQFKDLEGKRRLFGVDLPRAIARVGACGLLVSAPVWALPQGLDGSDGTHPNSHEVFLLSAFTGTGQYSRAAAVIRERQKAPELGPWEDLDGDISSFDNHLYRPAIQALAVANGK